MVAQPPGPGPGEDARLWVGRIDEGRRAEHEAFVEWLNGPEAAETFRRRRLTEYRLTEEDGEVRIVFRAPRTGDPRIMIDFLRYPGLWPEFWQFERGGAPAPSEPEPAGQVRVHWRRAPDGESTAGGA